MQIAQPSKPYKPELSFTLDNYYYTLFVLHLHKKILLSKKNTSIYSSKVRSIYIRV